MTTYKVFNLRLGRKLINEVFIMFFMLLILRKIYKNFIYKMNLILKNLTSPILRIILTQI